MSETHTKQLGQEDFMEDQMGIQELRVTLLGTSKGLKGH
jgi:hypothetical protein